jgi:hypothetical protein
MKVGSLLSSLDQVLASDGRNIEELPSSLVGSVFAAVCTYIVLEGFCDIVTGLDVSLSLLLRNSELPAADQTYLFF